MANAPRPRVLVVDDDRTVRELLQVVLSDRYDVLACSAGEEALLERTRPDALLVDLDLGKGLSGEELAARARGLPQPPAVILMSSDWLRLERARSLGEVLLRKPFSFSHLRAVLDASLGSGGRPEAGAPS